MGKTLFSLFLTLSEELFYGCGVFPISGAAGVGRETQNRGLPYCQFSQEGHGCHAGAHQVQVGGPAASSTAAGGNLVVV